MAAVASSHTRFLIYLVATLVGLWLMFDVGAFAILAGAWIAILFQAYLLSNRGLHGLRLFRRIHNSSFEDDTLRVRLTIENRSPHDEVFLELADRFGPSLVDVQRVQTPPLPSRTRRHLDYLGSCSRRWGVYRVGPLRTYRTDPLGLFESSTVFAQEQWISVFPQVYELGAFPYRGGGFTHAAHPWTADRAGASQLHLGLRDYHSGDETRRIHWPATARHAKLLVKEYETDLVPYFSLFLDLHRDHRAGTGRKSTLEFLVRTGASLLWTAARRRHFIQVFAEGQQTLTVPPGVGETHFTFALHQLIQVAQDGERPLTDVVLHHLTQVPPRSTAGLVFSTAALRRDDLEGVLDALDDRHVAPVLIFVDLYAFAPVGHWPLPAAEVEARRTGIEELVAARGIPFHVVGPNDDLAEVLPGLKFPS